MRKVERIRTKNIPPLPTGEPAEPWGSVLHSVSAGFVTPSLPTEGGNVALQIIETEWLCYMHYVYKEKWNRSHKLPGKSEHTKIFGNYLLAALELCIQIHAIHPNGAYYKNAAKWFDSICWEMKHISRREIHVEGGIKYFVKKCRSVSFDYKGYVNPHSKSTETHIYRLVDAVIEIHSSGLAPSVIDKYWKPFVKSLTAYTTYLDKDGVTCFFADAKGQLWIQSGKGRNQVLVPNGCINKLR